MPSFESRDFRMLFLSGFFTAGARWAMVLGRGWLVFDMTGSATAVGAVTFSSFIPFTIFGPIAGVLADRFDRRAQLLAATSSAVVFSAILAVLTLSEIVELWHVIVLSLLSGLAQAGTVPARQSLLPNLVSEQHLLNAIALGAISQHGSRVVGPLFGAALLASVGTGYVFVLSTALLLMGVLGVAAIEHRRSAGTSSDARGISRAIRGLGSDLLEGVAYATQDRRVATVMVMVMIHCGLTMAFDSMMPSLSKLVGGGSTTYSAVLVGIGAGSIVGTFALSLVQTSVATGRALVVTAVGSGIAMILLGVAQTPTAVVGAAVFVGATEATFMALSSALIQQVVPDALRGRVMSLYIMMSTSHMAFLGFGYGWAADSISVRIVLIGPAVIWTVFFIAAGLSLGEVRHMIRRGKFRPLLTSASASVSASEL
jgi:MFS family permease